MNDLESTTEMVVSEAKGLSAVSMDSLSSSESPDNQGSTDRSQSTSGGVSYLSPKHPNITSRKRDLVLQKRRGIKYKGFGDMCCPSDVLLDQKSLMGEQDLTVRDTCAAMSHDQLDSLSVSGEMKVTQFSDIVNNNTNIEKICDSMYISHPEPHEPRPLPANSQLVIRNVASIYDVTDFVDESVDLIAEVCLCFAVQSVASLPSSGCVKKEQVVIHDDASVRFCQRKAMPALETMYYNNTNNSANGSVCLPSDTAICSENNTGQLPVESCTEGSFDSRLLIDNGSFNADNTLEMSVATMSIHDSQNKLQNHIFAQAASHINPLSPIDNQCLPLDSHIKADKMEIDFEGVQSNEGLQVDDSNSLAVSLMEESCLNLASDAVGINAQTESMQDSTSFNIEDMFSKLSLVETKTDKQSLTRNVDEPGGQVDQELEQDLLSVQEGLRQTRSATRRLRERNDVQVVFVHPDVTKRQSITNFVDIGDESDEGHNETSWQRCYMRRRRIRSPQIADIGAADTPHDNQVKAGEASRTSARRRSTRELLAEAEQAVNQRVPLPSPRTAYRQMVAQTSDSLQRTLHLRRTSLAHQRPDVDQVIDSQQRLLEAVLDSRPAGLGSLAVNPTLSEGYGDQVPYWVFAVTLLVTLPGLIYWIIFL